MPIIRITDIDDERIAQYARLTEAQLRNRLNPHDGIFIAESPKVIRVAISAGYEPLSILCEERHINGDAQDIISRYADIEVFTGEREILSAITGYTLTRGVLSAMRRKPLAEVADLCSQASRIAVIDGVVDTTNIGAIFRSAAAMEIDAVLLTPTSCDPLNRRSIRVSMGTIFQVPWTWIGEDYACLLRKSGFKTVAMALTDDSVSIDNPELCAEPRLAIALGNEGDGLSKRAISEADYVARIPMRKGVDSLNVAAAAAVAFWQLRKKS